MNKASYKPAPTSSKNGTPVSPAAPAANANGCRSSKPCTTRRALGGGTGRVVPADPHSAGALLFTCNGRGSRMFDETDHDVKRVQAQLGADVPVAGFFAMGEIGRVGEGSQLHGFTASTAIYRPVGT